MPSFDLCSIFLCVIEVHRGLFFMLLALLFFLLASHALMDYSLQSETIASCKCRGSDNTIAKSVPWYYWMTAHALLHGGGVGAVVRWFGFEWATVVELASAETVLHWVIDHGKCLGWFGIHTDQLLHISCKLLWWGLLASKAFGTPGT